MAKKLDKHDVKDPDAFLTFSEQIFKYLQKHGVVYVSALVAVLVVALGYVGYNFFKSSQETKAANAIYKAEAKLKKAESSLRDERAKKTADLSAKKAPQEAVTPADFAKDFAPSVEAVKVEIAKYSGTRAALVSALNLSYFLVDQKQYAEAEQVLNVPSFKPAAGDLLNGFLLMHHGLALLESGKADEALKSYEEVTKQAGLKDFQPLALLKMGVVYQSKGDTAKAREQFEKVAREFPETEAAASAQNYLRLIDLKTGKQG